jgi:hypothetical protein
VYPNPKVEPFIKEQFVPARFHIKDQQPAFQRFNVQWTPTILILDSDGTERHRIEGFLPSDDFLAQLRLGLAHTARLTGNFVEAERLYRELADDPTAKSVAPEALYWAGVSRYKATNDGAALADTARQFQKRFSDSLWAKKASVWAA